MEEIKFSKINKVKVLQAALEILKKGGVIIYPTETSYGLGCDFYNKEAVAKIYKIKQRNDDKNLPVIVPDLIAASYLVEFPVEAKRLAMKYWPGPLTLILPFKYCKWQPQCEASLALRVSSHPLASDLANNFGKPIVATSANISEQSACYSPNEIAHQFKGLEKEIDLFINAGILEKNIASTLVKFEKDKIKIIRQGEIRINPSTGEKRI